MKRRKKPLPKSMRGCAAHLGPGDGLDPRFDPKGQDHKVENRKALQLCSQVRRALSAVLAGDSDEVLRDLLVAAVTPAPDSSRLLVAVALTTLANTLSATEVLPRLGTAQGRLRSEMAAAIHRRRTPELMFQLCG